MTPKEKKAFVKKMREAKEAKAKERKKQSKLPKKYQGAKSIKEIEERKKHPLVRKMSSKSNPHNETVKFMGLEKTKKPIPDYIMAEAMDDGFELPSGWFKMSKSMQLGFLKKFARRTY